MSRAFWGGVALVLASIALGLVIASGAVKGIDVAVFKALALTQAHSAALTISVARMVTTLGDPGTRSIAVILFLAVLAWRRSWRSAMVFLVTVALSITGHSVMKEAFARARPTLVPWLDHADTYAYPSGHAAGTMVVLLLGSLLIADRWLVWVAVLVSVAIGLSRISLGVHWPSDVVGGWMFGGGMALIGYATVRVTAPIEARQLL